MKDIRWKQRFENFEKAFLFFKKATVRDRFDELQAAGLIHSFEFTFELAWKTLKDYLEFSGISVQSPRDTIKKSFAAGLITDGHLWIQMLDKRNEVTHAYNEMQAERAIDLIKNQYAALIEQVYHTLKSFL